MTKNTKMLIGSSLALFCIFIAFQNFESIPNSNDLHVSNLPSDGGVNSVNLNCQAFSRAVNYCTLSSADTLVQIEDVSGDLHAYYCDKAIQIYRISNCMQGN